MKILVVVIDDASASNWRLEIGGNGLDGTGGNALLANDAARSGEVEFKRGGI